MDLKLIAEICKECIEEYNNYHVLDIPSIFIGGMSFNDDHYKNTTSLGGWCKFSDTWIYVWYIQDYENDTGNFFVNNRQVVF